MAAEDAKCCVSLVRTSNTGGPYLEIEVAKLFKGKPSKVVDREKVNRSETVDNAARRLLQRMQQESQL
jgi:hypothetical protein